MSIPALAVADAPAEEAGGALPSPGMVRRHYAPRATLLRVGRDGLDRALEGAPGPVGAVLLEGTTVAPRAGLAVRTLPRDAEGYARALFAVLHALDDQGCARIVVEEVPVGGAWAGVRDRLARAADSG
jgi:L-threonylcarbamoyladenylate synthase